MNYSHLFDERTLARFASALSEHTTYRYYCEQCHLTVIVTAVSVLHHILEDKSASQNNHQSVSQCLQADWNRMFSVGDKK